MYFIGVIVFVIGILFNMVLKGVPLVMLNNAPVIIVMLFSVIGVVVATSSFKVFTMGFNAVISKKYYISDENRLKAIELFKLISKVLLLVAFITSLIGITAGLSNLYDLDKLSHAIANVIVAFMECFAVIAIIFEPAAFILKHRMQEPVRIKGNTKDLSNKLLELCYQNGLTAEDIQDATSIQLKNDSKKN